MAIKQTREIGVAALQQIEAVHNGLVVIILETQFDPEVEDRILPLVEQLGEIIEQNLRD